MGAQIFSPRDLYVGQVIEIRDIYGPALLMTVTAVHDSWAEASHDGGTYFRAESWFYHGVGVVFGHSGQQVLF